MRNNLQENCPYYDRDNKKCTRDGCHLMIPCIAKGEPNEYKRKPKRRNTKKSRK